MAQFSLSTPNGPAYPDNPFGLGQFARSGPATPSALTRFFIRLAEGWNKKIWPPLVVALRYLLPLASLLLVFLSHYGTFLFANVFMIVYIGVISLAGGKVARRDVYYLVGCWLVAFTLAFMLYYYNHFDLILNQFTGGVGGNSSGAAKSPFDLFGTFRKIYTDSREWFGMVVLLAT